MVLRDYAHCRGVTLQRPPRSARRPLLYDKPATTVADQVTSLIGRGLLCPDRARAERHMRAIGYYRLSAYWLPFEDAPSPGQTRSRRFGGGTTWDDIIELYAFDRRLRLLIMEAIERFEVAVRSSWTNALTLAHGSHAYLDHRNFKDGVVHAKTIAQIASSASQSKEPFIQHYKKKYTTPTLPPLWSACEIMSLGQLSILYEGTLDNGVKDRVAKELNLPTKEVLESLLEVSALTRNICAHHGRLWNRRFVKRLRRVNRLASVMTFEPHPRGHETLNLIYNTLVVLIEALRPQGGLEAWHHELVALLNGVSVEKQDAMGFPRGWQTMPFWAPI